MKRTEYLDFLMKDIMELPLEKGGTVSDLVSKDWVRNTLNQKCTDNLRKMGNFMLSHTQLEKFLKDEIMYEFINSSLMSLNRKGLVAMSVDSTGEILYQKV